ncbi:hypothetical protein PENSPDRAFT_541759, partial [Peniophora sp. CONT]
IDTGDQKPLRTTSKPGSPLENAAIKELIDDGLCDGVIEPSESPWSSGLLPVRKRD